MALRDTLARLQGPAAGEGWRVRAFGIADEVTRDGCGPSARLEETPDREEKVLEVDGKRDEGSCATASSREEDSARSLGGAKSAAKKGKRRNRLGVDFVRASREVFELHLGEKGNGEDVRESETRVVKVKQDVGQKWLGAVVWDCGILMCRVLEAIFCREAEKAWLARATVLELGSGTGLAGLCAAKLGASRCVLSDLGAAEEMLRQNVELNSLQDSVRVETFEWGTSPPIRQVQLVLCSDVLYERKSYPALLSTLRHIFAANPMCVVLFTVKLRFPDAEASFFTRLLQQQDDDQHHQDLEPLQVHALDLALVPALEFPSRDRAELGISALVVARAPSSS